MSEQSDPRLPFDYGRPPAPISLFCVVCLLASILSFPCFIGGTASWLERHFQLGLIRENLPLVVFALPFIVLLASLVAYLRVEASNDRLRGGALAICAMVLSGLWTLFVTALMVFNHPVGNMH